MVFAVDMQKVVLLPRYPGLKEVVFCPRLITYNETFSPVLARENLKNIICLWHEAIKGLDAMDVTSAYYEFLKFLDSKGPMKRVTLWADNCGPQNKNYTLFSSLVIAVNNLSFKSITLRYLQKEHTHNKVINPISYLCN